MSEELLFGITLENISLKYEMVALRNLINHYTTQIHRPKTPTRLGKLSVYLQIQSLFSELRST